MKIILINGPNLNLLGQREQDIYGSQDFKSYLEELKATFPNVELSYFQSNHEGELIDCLHKSANEQDGIVLNAAAYTHTSIALADAVAAIDCPVIEVHISNIYARERFRRHSYLSKHCKGIISGFGLDSYKLAIHSFLK